MNRRRLRWFSPPLLLLAACGVYRLAAAGSQPETPVEAAKPQPNRVAPRYDLPLVATDEQLRAVLARMKPPTGPPDTNRWVHALRMWGPEAEFDGEHPGGQTMLRYFLDDAEFRRLAGGQAPPLFVLDEDGVRVRAWDEVREHDRTGAVHVDDLLATLAESGVPLDTPLITREGPATVDDLLRRALFHFDRRQHEYEWSAISYARYLYPTLSWQTRYGHTITVDQVVDELIAQDPHNGICSGTHRLEALVVLNRVDEQYGTMPRRTKRKLLSHLQDMSRRLVGSQYPQGQWSRNWPQGSEAVSGDPGSLAEQILATGHHLEWLALAPEEVLPPRETIVRAGQWIARQMQEIDDSEIERMYGPFTHAARALALWRGQEPYEAWRRLQAEQAE